MGRNGRGHLGLGSGKTGSWRRTQMDMWRLGGQVEAVTACRETRGCWLPGSSSKEFQPKPEGFR